MSTTRRVKGNVLNVDISSPSSAPGNNHGLDFAKVIDTKMLELREYIKGELKSSEDRVMEKLGALSAEFTNVRAEFKLLSDKFKLLNTRCDRHREEIEENKQILSRFENNLVASDVVIANVPNTIDVNSIMNKISNALECNDIRVSKIFRSQSKKNGSSGVIIAKLTSPDERASLFRSLAAFRKSKTRRLQLCDIGLNSNNFINIFECLSTYNKQLFDLALLHKRNKLINNVFTLRGEVYVRVQQNGKAIKVNNLKSLNDVVGSINK